MKEEKFDNALEIQSRYSKQRAEIFNLLKNISGNQWSYYSLHDFGVQLLENFFYKIEDLKIRSDSSILQILKYNELLPQNFSESIFINPINILPSNKALSKKDLWKIVVDKKGIKNCKIFLANEMDSNSIRGGYVVYLLQHNHLAYDKFSTKILREVSDKLTSKRALCEDFFEVKFLKKKKLRINLTISLEKYLSSNDLSMTIAQSIQNFQEYLTPSAKFHSMDDLIYKKNCSLSEILEGPILENGFIDNEEMNDRAIKNKIHISECIQKLCGTENHINILSIEFYGEDKKKFDTEIICDFDEYLFLDIKHSLIKILYKGTQIEVNQDQIESIYANISMKNFVSNNTSMNNKIEITDLIDFDDLTIYESIQFMFPYFLGLSSEKLLKKKNNSVSIKQLKGYLLFFDQILCNYIRLFDTLPKIFLNAMEEENNINDYLMAPKDVIELENLLKEPNNIGSFSIQKKFILSDKTKQKDEKKDVKTSSMHSYLRTLDKINYVHLQRVNKCLDFILEMFGEKYYREITLLEKLDEENQLKKEIINKKRILGLVKKSSINSDTDVSYFNTIEQLRKTICAFLDIEYNKNEEPNYKILENNVKNSNLFNLNSLKNYKKDEFEKLYGLDKNISEIKFSGNIYPLMDLIMKNCIDRNRFTVKKENKTRYLLEVEIDDNKENNISLLTDFHIDTKDHGNSLADRVVKYFHELNKKMEKIYLVEHILLRDRDYKIKNIDHYSFRMTIALPTWPSKFQSIGFKNLVNKIIIENIPAHIETNILWLGYEDFCFFEKLYFTWLKEFKENNSSPSVIKSAKNLMGLIISLSSDAL